MDVRRQGQPNERGDMSMPAPAAAPKRAMGGGVPQALYTLLFVIGVVFLVGVAWHVFNSLTADASVNGKEYQALFLTNGQVYFGKLTGTENNYVKLTDIFYLQVQQQVQPSSSSSNQQPSVSLAKLGGELHGPEDAMFVAKSQVLFWENLKPSGKVSQAIAQYKAGGGK